MTAPIRFTGMASGLPPNIVDQLIEAERIPLKTMEAQKTKEDEKLKLVTDLETKVQGISGSMSDLVGIRGFNFNKFVSGDPNVIDGTVDPATAVTGQWQIEVVQLAQKPGALSNGFPDKDVTEIGVGYLKFDTPEGRKEVYINGGKSTLEGVAKQVNASGLGLRATVLNDRKDHENPFRLLITGLATGDDNHVEFPTVYMLDGDQDLYFDQSRQAQNAKIKIDGFEIEVPDNIVNDLIPGVSLDLKQAAPGREIRVNVKEDMEVISGKMKSFVEAYNQALGFIQGQAKLTKGQDGKEHLGPLGGDSLLRTVENRLRSVILEPQRGVESEIKRVGEMGIEFTRNGTLNFNQDKFNAALKQNPRAVANFLRGDGFNVGFIPAVKRMVSTLDNSVFGPLANRKRSSEQKIDAINKRIESKERQLEKREESLRRQFADLETKMSKLQSQGGAVNAMAAAGPRQG